MNAHDSAIALSLALARSTDASLAGVSFYAHDTEVFADGTTVAKVEEIELPAVFVRVRFDSLAGSALIGKARIEVDVESQSDDDSSALHSQRESAVRAVFSDFAGLSSAFNDGGTVALCGPLCLVDNEPEVQSRAFKTPLAYKGGIQAL